MFCPVPVYHSRARRDASFAPRGRDSTRRRRGRRRVEIRLRGREVSSRYDSADVVPRAVRPTYHIARDAHVPSWRTKITNHIFCFFARGATGSALLDGHVRRSDEALHITLEHEKGKAKNARSRRRAEPPRNTLATARGFVVAGPVPFGVSFGQ